MYNRIMCSCLLLLSGLMSCQQQGSVQKLSARQEIDSLLAIQEKAYDMNNEEGRKLIEQTCEDSLMFIGGDDGGMVQSARFYSQDLANGYSQKPHDRTYAIYDNTAIVTSLQQTFTVINKDTIFFNSRYTKIFVKKNSKWKMAYVSYAPVPVLYHPQKAINNQLLKSYSGLYQSSAATIDTVTISNEGVLLLRSGNSISELYPLNDSAFWGKGYFGQTVFSKDHEGRIDQMYYQYPDGQRIHFPRLR